ncbi:MAG: LuxR family transcriptional response [Geobacteraceae bacterium]|nr:MAG: LuxR family transcriptional response [Geobacteraceae bacterium]
MSIRVLLADDHKIIRQGIRSILEKESGFEVVAEAETGRMAVQLAGKLLPDVVLMEISMPEMNGIEATRRIIAEISGVRVLALSMQYDRQFVVEELNAGARGYLMKDCTSEELVEAVRTVATDEMYLSSKISRLIVKDYMQNVPDSFSPKPSILTFRELEVLKLIGDGKNTKEIASALAISIKTVESHRQKIMQKLKLYSIAELTKYAVREGLTPLQQ